MFGVVRWNALNGTLSCHRPTRGNIEAFEFQIQKQLSDGTSGNKKEIYDGFVDTNDFVILFVPAEDRLTCQSHKQLVAFSGN